MVSIDRQDGTWWALGALGLLVGLDRLVLRRGSRVDTDPQSPINRCPICEPLRQDYDAVQDVIEVYVVDV